MVVVNIMNAKSIDNVQIEYMQQRLDDNEMLLSQVSELANRAHLSLSKGDLGRCEQTITELIQSIAAHFYEEVH